MVLEPTTLIDFDIGKGDLYIGNTYPIPYFYETPRKLMMHDPEDGDSISFKTWKGEFFQFFLTMYHGREAMVLTSTLGDCYFIFSATRSIEKSAERSKSFAGDKKPNATSVTGYSTWGRTHYEQYKELKEHLAEQEIYFSDSVIEEIWEELSRRAKA